MTEIVLILGGIMTTLAGVFFGVWLNSLGAKLDTVANTVNRLASNIGVEQEAIEGLRRAISSLDVTVGRLTTEIVRIDKEVSNLRTKVDGQSQ